jgi:hypothetical protein
LQSKLAALVDVEEEQDDSEKQETVVKRLTSAKDALQRVGEALWDGAEIINLETFGEIANPEYTNGPHTSISNLVSPST